MSCKRYATVIERPVALFLVATSRGICITCVKAEPAGGSQRAQDVSASQAMTVAFRPAQAYCKSSNMAFVQAHLHPAEIGTVHALLASAVYVCSAAAWRPSASRSCRSPCSAKHPILHQLRACLQAPCSRIEAICKQKLRVDPATVLDPEAPQALSALVLQLQRAQEEAAALGGAPPAMDPVADLKLNQLEVVQAVREHQQLMQVGQA